jgi:hypothetical protein
VKRIPDRLCLVRSATRGEALILTYRPVGGAPARDFIPKFFQLVGDAGLILEATATSERPDHVVVIRHGIGHLALFGLFGGGPSLAQLDRIASRDSSISQFGNIVLNPNGNINVNLACDQFVEGCPPSKASNVPKQ